MKAYISIMQRAPGSAPLGSTTGPTALTAFLAVLAVTLLLQAPPAHGQTVAIVNGEVHTVTGPVLSGATVVIRDGRIEAVGTDVEAPAGARVIDAAGRPVTPGLMESMTQMGVVELGAEPGPRDVTSANPRVSASFRVADGINPYATAIPPTRVAGVTRVVVAPAPGPSIWAGQGALVELGSDQAPEMIVQDPVAMYVVLGEGGASRAGGARGAALQQLREALEDARDLAANRAAFDGGARRDYALSRRDLDALQPVLAGGLPLVVNANRASDIRAALHLAREEGLDIVLAGAAEGWMVADEISAADVPVIVDPLVNLPAFETLGATLENAARLRAAGVRVILSSFDTSNARNLRQAAGNAVANGMDHGEALHAVTRLPAEVWGVADRVGALEPGLEADVVVWSGDPFELRTRADHVFIRGHEIPAESRQRDLFLRYRSLEGIPPR
jgi:imidazolonepropionase-like amidohydrolase